MTSEGNGNRRVLTKEELAARDRFTFKDETLYVPEIGGSVVLRSLTVRERETLPNPFDLAERLNEAKGRERTDAAIDAVAQTMAVIIKEPELTVEEAREFVGEWPVEALDRIQKAYAKLVGTAEEAAAAAVEFPDAGI